MGVFGTLLHGILTLLEIGIWVYAFLMVANGLMTILGAPKTKPIFKMVHHLTDPLLNLMRKKFPKLKQDGLDFSPWAVVIVLLIIKFVILYPLTTALFTQKSF